MFQWIRMSHVIHAHPAFWIQNFHFFWRTLRCSYFCSFSWGVVALSSEHKLFTCIVIHFHWIRCDFQAYISVTSETIEMTRWWLFQSCSRLNGKHNDDIGQHQHQFHFNESERIGKKKSANRFIFILNCVVHLKRPEMLNILKFLCHFCFVHRSWSWRFKNDRTSIIQFQFQFFGSFEVFAINCYGHKATTISITVRCVCVYFTSFGLDVRKLA